MKEIIKIAWRNLWRNKRRTAITSASILFAVFFALFMRSFQLGFYDHMINNTVESFSGFLQIQHIEAENEPSMENSFPCTDSLITAIANVDEVKAVVPRVETFALASSGNQTKGALIIGIDPVKEEGLSNPEHLLVKYRYTKEIVDDLKSNEGLPPEIKNKLNGINAKAFTSLGSLAIALELDEKDDAEYLKIISDAGIFTGSYIKPGDEGVLLADKLARYLRISVGDTLILLGQGYHGATAADIFPVRGIIKAPNPEIDNKLIYMDISRAQYYASLGNNVTSVAINLHDNSDENMFATQDKLNELLNSEMITVRNWYDFNKVLAQQIEGDNQSGKAFLALLYFIIFFGIFGTVLMMIHERYRELGVMVAVGMQKTKLAFILIYEMIFMGFIGVLSGIVVSLPILYYLHINPIRLTGDLAQVMEDYGFDPVMPLAWLDTYIIWQGLIVALMVILSCLYPLRKVFRLKEIEALRA